MLMTLKKFNLQTEQIIKNALPFYKLYMDGLNMKINKSELSRRLKLDRRTVDKYLNGYKKPESKKRTSYLGKYSDIIDELGYLPISKADSNLFFQLIDRRYERFSTIITTNINFSQWDEVFGDAMIANAIMDRLLHHANIVTIKGKPFRLAHLLNDDTNS